MHFNPTSMDLPDDPFVIVADHDAPGIAVHLHDEPSNQWAEVELTGARITVEALRAALEVVPDRWPVEVTQP